MVTLKHVSKTYAKLGRASVRALDDVCLDIEKGEFIAITGSSGSGKSTLMNILGLLDRPGEGRYRLDGEDVAGLDDDQLATLRSRKIGFVFQSFHLLPRTTARENVSLPLLYSRNNGNKLDAMDALELLEAVGLKDRANHYPSELSGGEQQRVAIARALMNGPELILADEPTGNLDSTSGNDVMKIFQDLNAQGRTIVLITHEAGIAALAQRIIKVSDGRIV